MNIQSTSLETIISSFIERAAGFTKPDGGPAKNLYEVLGVEPAAAEQAIKTAYRTLSKTYHPDASGGETEDIFKQINEAYEVLSDSSMRANYDAFERLRARQSFWHQFFRSGFLEPALRGNNFGLLEQRYRAEQRELEEEAIDRLANMLYDRHVKEELSIFVFVMDRKNTESIIRRIGETYPDYGDIRPYKNRVLKMLAKNLGNAKGQTSDLSKIVDKIRWITNLPDAEYLTDEMRHVMAMADYERLLEYVKPLYESRRKAGLERQRERTRALKEEIYDLLQRTQAHHF